MKILYANPIFLDYRLPFYKKLNELFNGEFYILYSTKRYKGRFESLLNKIPQVMGTNAIPFEKEFLFDTYERSFKRYNTEKGKKIPFTLGLIRTIRKVKPDIIITEGFYQWTPLIILYHIIYNVPVLMGYERTLHTERNNSIFKTIHRKLTDLFIDGYLVNGSETKKYLLSIGIDNRKIYVGGMSADSSGLKKAIMDMSLDEKIKLKNKYINNKGLIFLFSGQIVERKGVKYLLRAWIEHIKKWQDDALVLIGTGYQIDELRELYSNEKSIHFLGRIPYEEVYKYYAIADVFILPTIEDNWSLVIPEAMACGLPVTTSIYNGCYPELVKEGVNGITFDTFNQKTIINALDYFHHINLLEFGKQSIELEKPFNTDNSTRRTYDAIYDIYNKKYKSRG